MQIKTYFYSCIFVRSMSSLMHPHSLEMPLKKKQDNTEDPFYLSSLILLRWRKFLEYSFNDFELPFCFTVLQSVLFSAVSKNEYCGSSFNRGWEVSSDFVGHWSSFLVWLIICCFFLLIQKKKRLYIIVISYTICVCSWLTGKVQRKSKKRTSFQN